MKLEDFVPHLLPLGVMAVGYGRQSTLLTRARSDIKDMQSSHDVIIGKLNDMNVILARLDERMKNATQHGNP